MPSTAPALWLAWAVALAFELGLAAGLPIAPTSTQLAVELGVGVLLAGFHAHFSRGVLASPIWPAALLLLGAIIRHHGVAEGVTVAVVTLALAVGSLRIHRSGLLLIGVAASGFGVLGARDIALHERAPQTWPGRLAAELTRALPKLSRLPDHPGMVVITIDTLRWDVAPEMDSWKQLAAKGHTWRRAMSTASWTAPALASTWTGLSPIDHGCGASWKGGTDPVRGDVPLLAEQLQAQGTVTAAFVSNPYASGDLGFDRGFDTWHHVDEETPAELLFAGRPPPPAVFQRADEVVISKANAWLSAAPDRGFVLGVHLVGPPLPYAHTKDALAMSVSAPGDIRSGRLEDTPPLRRAVRAAYAGEVAETDLLIGGLLHALESRSFEGAIVLTADHGEEFWEHGGFEHGHSHHGEVIDVPLVLVAPGLSEDTRTDLASLVDITPTLRGLAGLKPNGLDLRRPIPEDRIATAAGNLYLPHARSARQGQNRIIVTEAVSQFDLWADPREQHPEPVTGRSVLLEAALASQPAAAGDEAVQLDPEALRALGYIE